jgi:hypothetical protein
VVLVLAVAAGAPQAQTPAKKPKPAAKPFPEARKDYEEAAKGTDAPALVEALTDLARSGFLSDDRREKAFARGALKRCLRHKAKQVRVAAAAGYGVLLEPGSSRDLRSILKQAPRGRLDPDLVLAAIDSFGRLHDRGGHLVLLSLIEKPAAGDDRKAQARAAARALRGYRVLPRAERAEIVSDLMFGFDKLFRVAHRRVDEDSLQARWWKAVEPDLVSAFNALTRQRWEDYYECTEWWSKNRRAFAEPEPDVD